MQKGLFFITLVVLFCLAAFSGCTGPSASAATVTAAPSATPAILTPVATTIPTAVITTTPATTPATTVPQTTQTTKPSSTGEKPTVKILETNPAGNIAMVNVEFTNPTDEDLTMTAILQVTYQYGGGGTGVQQGRSSSSGMAQADVAAHDKRLATAKIELGGFGSAYVDGMATLSNFQYTKVVKNKAGTE